MAIWAACKELQYAIPRSVADVAIEQKAVYRFSAAASSLLKKSTSALSNVNVRVADFVSFGRLQWFGVLPTRKSSVDKALESISTSFQTREACFSTVPYGSITALSINRVDPTRTAKRATTGPANLSIGASVSGSQIAM